jgi:hypothetical protein
VTTLTSPPLAELQTAARRFAERDLTPAGKPPWFGTRLIVLVTLLTGVLLGLAPVLTGPAVVPSSAPVSVFSGERAMHDLRVIAAAPRPIGSPGNAAARAYIIGQLTSIGLQPEVQTGVGFGHFPGSPTIPAGLVNNVVARRVPQAAAPLCSTRTMTARQVGLVRRTAGRVS